MKKILATLLILFFTVSCSFSENQVNVFDQFIREHPSRLLSRFLQLIHYPVPPEQSMSDKSFMAHIYMSPETLSSVKEGWIPYFHRHNKHDDINNVIQLLLRKKALKSEYNHFFAYILHLHPTKLDELKKISLSLKSEKKAAVDQLITKAGSFQKAHFSQAIEHSKIWQEYAVTGDIELIKKYIRLLDDSQNQFDNKTVSKIETVLYSNAIKYFPVYQQLRSQARRPDGPYKSRLEKLTNRLSNKIYTRASTAWTKGDNFRKLKEYEQAITTLREGLHFAPDYPYLYRITGEILVMQNKQDDAMASFYCAKWTSPDKLLIGVLFQIAKIYNSRNEGYKVIDAYKEALLLDPHYPDSLGNLAWAYDRVGDTDNAEKYYRETLLYKPNHGLIEYAFEFFRDHNIAPPEIDKSINDLFMQRQFAELESIFADALDKREKNDDGILKIYDMYDELSPSYSGYAYKFDKYFEVYNEWLTLHPDSYLANASYGIFYLAYAWNARGRGYEQTISQKGWDEFNNRLRLATKYLNKAYEIDPTKVGVPTRLISIAKVNPDLPNSDVDKWFNIAITIDPSDATPYIKKAGFMAPKWGGTMKELFEFARETYKNAPDDSMAPVVLTRAHWILYRKNKAYLKRPEVWAEMKSVQNELIRRFPNSMERHNWFALSACFAEDYKTARREFKAIANNWSEDIWANRESFENYKNIAFSNTQ